MSQGSGELPPAQGQIIRKNRNFVKENLHKVVFDKPTVIRKIKLVEPLEKPKNIGKIPRYLQKFNNQRDELRR